MTDYDLTQLREIAEAATSGPWHYIGIDFRGERSHSTKGAAGSVVAFAGYGPDGGMSNLNATHIAAFDPPTAIALIDELERLREVVATVKAITNGTPECDKYDDKSPVTCGWKFDLQRIKEVVK